jgi:G3E family GTPase
MAADQAVPMTILNGFLGAGKTTLLNRILTGDHGLRVAVLVNDFGAINIDAELVVGVQDNMISLANGCVCCEVRDDLVESVDDLLNSAEVEYIVLEASGIAEPSSIAMTFLAAALRDRIRVDSITCVVDTDQLFAHPEHPALLELKMRQIGFSDMLILNKVEIAGPDQVAHVRRWIDTFSKNIRIVETNYCDVPYEILLGVGRFDPERITRIGSDGFDPDHAQAFDTWTYESDRPLSIDALRGVAKKLPGSIYRCKGIVYTTDDPERRGVLQVVGRRADVALHDGWGDRKRRTQIVAIGAAGSIDADDLQERFEACVVA